MIGRTFVQMIVSMWCRGFTVIGQTLGSVKIAPSEKLFVRFLKRLMGFLAPRLGATKSPAPTIHCA